MIRIKNSGLKDLYDKCTLETFHAVEEWQKGMLSIAQRFLKNPKGKWMFAGGQPGAGEDAYLHGGCAGTYGEWLPCPLYGLAGGTGEDKGKSERRGSL